MFTCENVGIINDLVIKHPLSYKDLDTENQNCSEVSFANRKYTEFLKLR